ncbi:SGNH/GDSL hydrolase family protein [bacterium]|nr:SGNH/GDSL hydrolase family protein [bacterium]
MTKPNRFDRPWIKLSLAGVILGFGALMAGVIWLIPSTVPKIVTDAVVSIAPKENKPVVPPELRYISGYSFPDDRVGYRSTPYTWMRQYYVDNPRGYFQEISAFNQSVENWNFSGSKEAEVNVEHANEFFPLILKIKQLDPKAPAWSASIRHKEAISPANIKTQLKFNISATQKRHIEILFWTPGDWNNPFHVAGVDIDTQPKDYVIDLPVSDKDRRFVLGFNLGGESDTLTVKSISLSGIKHLEETKQHDRFFVEYGMNKWGYRDHDWTLECPSDTIRIASIGDSFTFGQGVRSADVFSHVLERKLNSEATNGSTKFEVLNFGMMGYSTSEELEILQVDAAKFSPRIVVVTMCSNDSISLKREAELKKVHDQQTDYARFNELLSKTIKEEGFKGCVDLLLQMNAFCKSKNMRLVVGIFDVSEGWEWENLVAEVLPAMKQHGIPAFDVKSDLEAAGYFATPGIVHDPTDFHPNEHAHAVYAKKLYNVIEKEILPTLSK